MRIRDACVYMGLLLSAAACMEDRLSDDRLAANAAAQGHDGTLAGKDALAGEADADATPAEGDTGGLADAAVDLDATGPGDNDGDGDATHGNGDAADAGDAGDPASDVPDAGQVEDTDAAAPLDSADAPEPADDGSSAEGDTGDAGPPETTGPDTSPGPDGATPGDSLDGADGADAPDAAVAACPAGACDDGNGCTVDVCKAPGDCAHTPAADGVPCTATTACAAGATCKAGTCTNGDAKLFDLIYPGLETSQAQAVVPVGDGFAIAGYTYGKADGEGWLVRIDGAGKLLWQKNFGGASNDYAAALVALPDGFAFAGQDLSASEGKSNDAWLVKVDLNGNVVWQKTLGGKQDDWAKALVSKGQSLVFAGYTHSKGAGEADAWLVQVDASGGVIWESTFGTAGPEHAFALAAAPTGFALAGSAYNAAKQDNDLLLIRTDDSGKALWDAKFGATKSDIGTGVVSLPDGFLVSGVSGPNPGTYYDAWLVRTDAAGTLLWERTYGGAGHDGAHGVVVTAVGFAFAGRTNSKGAGDFDVWLVGVDTFGNSLWDATFGGNGGDTAFAVVALPDGFAVTGDVLGPKKTGNVATLIRTDAWGHASCAAAGVCAGKAAGGCNDGNPCTADLCAAGIGCSNAILPDGAPCAGGKVCKAGACLAK